MYRRQISLWTDAPHLMSSGKCKLKQQWDTTMHLLEWPEFWTPATPNADKDAQQQLSFLVGMQNGAATLGNSLVVSYKINHTLTVKSNNFIFGIYPKELKSHVHTKTCTWMFMADLFINAKTCKQPSFPWVGEWINKLWYMQAKEYYLAIKEVSYQTMKRRGGNLNEYY